MAAHILLLTACYLWAARARGTADRHSAELARMRADQDHRAALAREEERTRIAREVHDIVGHNLTVVRVQAATALTVDTVEQMRTALGVIADVSTGALSEVRQLVGTLRTEEATAPTGDLAALDADCRAAAAAGARLRWALPDGDVLAAAQRNWPVLTRSAVVRVVQEGLTNVLRHGGATPRAELTVEVQPDTVRVEVVNESAAPSPPADRHETPGHGLVGLTERVALAGGSLQAGPEAGRFRLTAVLPVRQEQP